MADDKTKELVDHLVAVVAARSKEQMDKLQEQVGLLARNTMALLQQRNNLPYHEMALAAMDSLIRSPKTLNPEQLATKSYDIADAMVTEGEKRERKAKGLIAIPRPSVGNDDLEDIADKIETALGARDAPVPVGAPGGDA